MSMVWVTDYLALTHLRRGELEPAVALMEPNHELCDLGLACCGAGSATVTARADSLDEARESFRAMGMVHWLRLAERLLESRSRAGDGRRDGAGRSAVD